jgi:hypothetical protein
MGKEMSLLDVVSAKRFCKDCKWYWKPVCKRNWIETGYAAVFVARKGFCQDWENKK